VSSVLDLDELMQLVVDLVLQQLDLYYAGLFLVDESGEWTEEPGRWAVLRAGTGQAGREMLAQQHKLEVGGSSMIGQCIDQGRAKIALDVGRVAVRFDNPLLPYARSELALPLISRGQTVGAMTIQSSVPLAFSQEDVSALQLMADQLADAIQTARLYAESQGALERIRARAEQLSILNEVGEALAARPSVHGVLMQAYQGASRLLNAPSFYIGLYDPDRNEVAFPLDMGSLDEDRFEVLSAEEGLTGYVIRNRKSVLIGDNVQQRLAEMGVESLGALALSWMGVPLMLGDRVLGAMVVQSYTVENAFDEHDRDLLTALARLTATALQSARLLERAEARVARERLVGEITEQMQRATDMQSLMRTAAEGLTRALGASRAYVRMGTEQEMVKERRLGERT
jgi:GAF domain-containing protein